MEDFLNELDINDDLGDGEDLDYYDNNDVDNYNYYEDVENDIDIYRDAYQSNNTDKFSEIERLNNLARSRYNEALQKYRSVVKPDGTKPKRQNPYGYYDGRNKYNMRDFLKELDINVYVKKGIRLKYFFFLKYCLSVLIINQIFFTLIC